MTTLDPLAGLDCSKLTDQQLLTNLKLISERGRTDLLRLLKHLAEMDVRNLARTKGYPSLFEYCVRELRFSESAAYRRISAAKLGRRFPEIYGRLSTGELNLTSLRLLGPHLDENNQAELLEEACGKSRLELERLLARFATLTEKPESIRFVQPMAAETVGSRDSMPLLAAAPAEASAASLPATAPAPAPIERRAELRFTVGDDVLKKLDRVRAVLYHIKPHASCEFLFGAGIEALLGKHDPGRKSARRARATAKKAVAMKSRRIPESIRQEVRARDGGRCTFVSADGRECGSAVGLEFDHVRPWALGGASDEPENVRLLCRGHNQLLAEKTFGRRH